MRLANVPPPMALHEITLEENAVDVAISINRGEPVSVLIVVLHRDRFSLFQWPLNSLANSPPIHKRTCPLAEGGRHSGFMARQITCNGDAILVLFSTGEATGLERTNVDGGLDGSLLSKQAIFHMDIECIVTNGPYANEEPSFTLKMGQERDPSLLERLASQIQVDTATDLTFKTISSIPGNEAIRHFRENGKDDIFSLTENGSLFANDQTIAKNCTSFLLTQAHLIFITSRHLLKFVHLIGNTAGKTYSLIQIGSIPLTTCIRLRYSTGYS